MTALRAYGSFGTAIGVSGAVLDGGEIYVGGSSSLLFGPNDYWYALRHVPGTRGYEQVFVSRRLPWIAALGVADVSGDGRKEVVVAQDDGRVVLFDQRSRVEIATLTVAAFNVIAMSLSDLDGDQKAEILLTTGLMGGNMLYVLTGGGALLWQRAGAGGELAVGNMDRDRSLEIATAAGPVIDWESRTVQWQRPQRGLAVDLAAGDFDGDGMDELIVADYCDFIFAFDVDTQSPKWSLYSFNTNVIWLGHADADPALELLVGEAQWGEVLAYDMDAGVGVGHRQSSARHHFPGRRRSEPRRHPRRALGRGGLVQRSGSPVCREPRHARHRLGKRAARWSLPAAGARRHRWRRIGRDRHRVHVLGRRLPGRPHRRPGPLDPAPARPVAARRRRFREGTPRPAPEERGRRSAVGDRGRRRSALRRPHRDLRLHGTHQHVHPEMGEPRAALRRTLPFRAGRGRGRRRPAGGGGRRGRGAQRLGRRDRVRVLLS